MPKSKELVSSSSSGSDSDSEVEKKLKRKKQVVPEKPVKKQKPGETSRALASSKQSSSSRDDNITGVTGVPQQEGPPRLSHGCQGSEPRSSSLLSKCPYPLTHLCSSI
uniref:Activated RNA polymerase II transcriptional coactivator p15 n=1 Tax=Peromyscus maniculatus bairdii TaxID=230844 RepID=A0A8C8W8P7_PERMB